jgi:hypothetical protein
MPVSITDVRIHLNNITPEEVADETIGQKISDADAFATEIGLTAGAIRDRFVRCWAAWRSFIISRSYKKVKIGVLEVQEDLGLKADALKQEAEDALADATGGDLITVGTPMFDDRPEDPFECTGNSVSDVDQTKLNE